jgi:hypothetical protein
MSGELILFVFPLHVVRAIDKPVPELDPVVTRYMSTQTNRSPLKYSHCQVDVQPLKQQLTLYQNVRHKALVLLSHTNHVK